MNMIDITDATDEQLDAILNLTPAAAEVFAAAKADPETPIAVDGLTRKDRASLAAAMGWNFWTPSIARWIEG